MPPLISLQEKPVSFQGLNPHSFPNQTKVKEFFFDEDFQNFKILKNLPPPTTNFPEPPLLIYPGAGTDILSPLIYIQALFPQVKVINLLFVDTQDTLGIIKTILVECNISLKQNGNVLSFYWNNLLVNLTFQTTDIFTFSFLSFDIYFERLFRIYKEQHPSYEQTVLAHLKTGGFLISDSGFVSDQLESLNAPKNLSIYQEMIIAKKKE